MKHFNYLLRHQAKKMRASSTLAQVVLTLCDIPIKTHTKKAIGIQKNIGSISAPFNYFGFKHKSANT